MHGYLLMWGKPGSSKCVDIFYYICLVNVSLLGKEGRGKGIHMLIFLILPDLCCQAASQSPAGQTEARLSGSDFINSLSYNRGFYHIENNSEFLVPATLQALASLTVLTPFCWKSNRCIQIFAVFKVSHITFSLLPSTKNIDICIRGYVLQTSQRHYKGLSSITLPLKRYKSSLARTLHSTLKPPKLCQWTLKGKSWGWHFYELEDGQQIITWT